MNKVETKNQTSVQIQMHKKLYMQMFLCKLLAGKQE